MPTLTIEVPHHLEQKEALHRIQQLLTKVKEEQAGNISGLTENWTGFTGSFSFMARATFLVSGTLVVGVDKVQLIGTLPWAAIFFQDRIESKIRTEAAKLLE